MVVRPSKRPMPWSACTTRSPTDRLVASVMNVGGAARLAARAHQPVAEDVLLADDGELGRLEALLEPEHGERGRRPPAAPAPRRSSRPWRASARPCSASSVDQPLARAGREGGDDRRACPAPAGCAHAWTTASNTLTPSPCWRSAAKLRARRGPRQDRTVRDRLGPPRTASCGVRRALSGCRAPRFASSRNIALGRHRLVGRRAEGLLSPAPARRAS